MAFLSIYLSIYLSISKNEKQVAPININNNNNNNNNKQIVLKRMCSELYVIIVKQVENLNL